jgi:hypothetical protein
MTKSNSNLNDIIVHGQSRSPKFSKLDKKGRDIPIPCSDSSRFGPIGSSRSSAFVPSSYQSKSHETQSQNKAYFESPMPARRRKREAEAIDGCDVEFRLRRAAATRKSEKVEYRKSLSNDIPKNFDARDTSTERVSADTSRKRPKASGPHMTGEDNLIVSSNSSKDSIKHGAVPSISQRSGSPDRECIRVQALAPADDHEAPVSYSETQIRDESMGHSDCFHSSKKITLPTNRCLQWVENRCTEPFVLPRTSAVKDRASTKSIETSSAQISNLAQKNVSICFTRPYQKGARGKPKVDSTTSQVSGHDMDVTTNPLLHDFMPQDMVRENPFASSVLQCSSQNSNRPLLNNHLACSTAVNHSLNHLAPVQTQAAASEYSAPPKRRSAFMRIQNYKSASKAGTEESRVHSVPFGNIQLSTDVVTIGNTGIIQNGSAIKQIEISTAQKIILSDMCLPKPFPRSAFAKSAFAKMPKSNESNLNLILQTDEVTCNSNIDCARVSQIRIERRQAQMHLSSSSMLFPSEKGVIHLQQQTQQSEYCSTPVQEKGRYLAKRVAVEQIDFSRNSCNLSEIKKPVDLSSSKSRMDNQSIGSAVCRQRAFALKNTQVGDAEQAAPEKRFCYNLRSKSLSRTDTSTLFEFSGMKIAQKSALQHSKRDKSISLEENLVFSKKRRLNKDMSKEYPPESISSLDDRIEKPGVEWSDSRTIATRKVLNLLCFLFFT